MENWQRAWRDGFEPLLPLEGLEKLARALEEDDPRLYQGATTVPAPLECLEDWQVEKACAVTYVGWQGLGLDTVGECEDFFARMCFECDQRLGEPAGCRWLLQWFDEGDRARVFAQLLEEVRHNIAKRKGAHV